MYVVGGRTGRRFWNEIFDSYVLFSFFNSFIWNLSAFFYSWMSNGRDIWFESTSFSLSRYSLGKRIVSLGGGRAWQVVLFLPRFCCKIVASLSCTLLCPYYHVSPGHPPLLSSPPEEVPLSGCHLHLFSFSSAFSRVAAVNSQVSDQFWVLVLNFLSLWVIFLDLTYMLYSSSLEVQENNLAWNHPFFSLPSNFFAPPSFLQKLSILYNFLEHHSAC